jgi:phospholipid/cholesterol/gamma-HCH transport system ATP-binding protein
MFKGKKLWEGNKYNIAETEVKELQDFIYANNLMRTMTKK